MENELEKEFIMPTLEEIWEFGDEIHKKYIFEPITIKEIGPKPRLRSTNSKDARLWANELEIYEKELEIIIKERSIEKEKNEKIINNFINDTIQFLKLENHPKKEKIIKYCKKQCRSDFNYNSEYLAALYSQFVSILEIVEMEE